MFNSIKSANCNQISPNRKTKSMTKGNHYHHQHQSHQINHNHSHHHHDQSKKSSTISLNIHDTNDIRYSRSNTQLQLTRLSLSASLIDIYFGKHYRSPDVLVVTGFILILIGLGAILIGVCVYFNEDEFQEMTFLVGFAMAAIGFICCTCRIILFGSPVFNCCLTIKSSTNDNYHNQRRPTNPPFFTAASSAMSTVTSIGVRFNSSRAKKTISNDEQKNNQTGRGIDSPSKSILNDLSITSIHGDSLESIETIKDEIDHQLDHSKSNQKMETINPSMLQFISKLGNKT